MRGRWGGVVGDVLTTPQGGIYRMTEAYAHKKSGGWPGDSLSVFDNPSQTVDVTLNGNATISLFVSSTYQTTAYQWQVLDTAGSGWQDVAGETSGSISLTGLTSDEDEYKYRLLASAGLRNVVSQEITIQYDSDVLISWGAHPQNTTVAEGNFAFFSVFAQGTGANYGNTYSPNFLWEVSVDGGNSWSVIAGETNYSIAILTSAADSGNQYRAKATVGEASSYSNPATLTVT